MDITGSKTFINLARSFAGESQARTRYAIYAERARKDGFAYIGYLFDYIGNQELAHANMFLKHLSGGTSQPLNNINIAAGYPYEYGDTLANLQGSSKHEKDEADTIYPAFAREAQQEGFAPIARLYEYIASVETLHSRLEEALHMAMAQGKLYVSDTPVVWKCSNCGYELTANEPWLVCPLCAHNQGFVIPQAAMKL
jgi:rubrerythrin